MKRRAGFTLIEVLVVVIIVSVLAVAAMPKMRGTFQQSRLKGSARELAGFLRLVRNTAVLREKPCQIVFDLEKDRYWLVLMDENGAVEDLNKRQMKSERKQFKIGEEMTGFRVLPKDVHIPVIYSGAPLSEKGQPRVIYYPDGSATPATIVLQDVRKQAFNIEIYQTTGIAHVESGLPVKMNDSGNEKDKYYYGPKRDGGSS